MPEKFYAEIFKHSGASYHKAMQLFPNARDEEFNATISLLQVNDQDRLLDVPAGGGYLRRYINDSIEYNGCDFSGGFVPNSRVGRCSETNIPLENNAIDKAVCLASMHHVENKAGFIGELHRCISAGGTLVIGDVIADSKEASFLNGFVNQWNSLGHHGDFIQDQRDLTLIRDSGFSVQYVTKHFRWNFTFEQECHTYLRLLFNLDNQPTEPVLRSAIHGLGSNSSLSGFHLNWSLGFIVATKL